jgi:hypothetical protein
VSVLKSRLSLLPLALASAAAVFGVSREAEALPLVTFSGSARGLYGSALGDPGLNAYGAGIGLRAGVTLPLSLYLGASLDYFLGEEKAGVSVSRLQVMGNVGYDLGFGPLTLRPFLGVGLSNGSADSPVGDTSESDLVVAPGAEFAVGLGLLSVSAEARYNKVVADGDADALVLGLGLGFSL